VGMQAEVRVETAAAMRDLGRRLAGVLRAGDLVLLAGPLGAGKTTLVQGIGEGLGVRGAVTSPTFVIARVHPALRGGPALVHADAYRLASPAEVDDLDLDASLGDSVTVVEWGGGLAEGLAADRLEITIERPRAAPGALDAEADEPRTVRVTGTGPRWESAADSAGMAVRGGLEGL
jgi:tRNA threonylcarbamoyladenosine biosynthesis protein TsaE